MSRRRGPAKRSVNPPRREHGFVTITHVRCPDCEYEGHLNNIGRPIVIEGGGLRGSTKDVGIVTRSHGCPTCKGKGSLKVNPDSIESVDPYALKR